MPVTDKTIEDRQFRRTVDLVNSTTDTPGDDIADVSTAVAGVDGTASNAASLVDTNARLVVIGQNFADLTGKINEILAILRMPS